MMDEKGDVQKVSDKYPELFHYTTAAGIEGIISSNSLWATHYAYVNDKEEFNAFFDCRLPEIIQECARSVISERYQVDATAMKEIDASGGLEVNISNVVEALSSAIKDVSKNIYEPHFISFCGVHSNNQDKDGLLSQWRGYGTDGGYIIAFKTKELEELLHVENESFNYSWMNIGDVNYYDNKALEESALLEIRKHEADIAIAITNFLVSDGSLEGAHEAIIAMATAHKHKGFIEEAEVRIVCCPTTKEQVKQFNLGGVENKSFKDYSFLNRNGLLVPYIKLFEGGELPISRIIIGPHSDRDRRKKSVEKLLAKHGINVEVAVSDIPYIGK
ncbi:DUF2971 domain-containing protein [Methylophilus sp. Leaf414]|uniref:DUF2971 domain-containing protein n=1 Tax=Methylophilus sp. Leaf414 TaxID=1736371 RepID=UPI0006F7D5E2|nr:DUF2971 domain-containing protein [Methylophilus sp. Leaf414]KQT37649.1 hypothetical protein ASG24_01240 [Methylophilus sp. Leaf414]